MLRNFLKAIFIAWVSERLFSSSMSFSSSAMAAPIARNSGRWCGITVRAAGGAPVGVDGGAPVGVSGCGRGAPIFFCSGAPFDDVGGAPAVGVGALVGVFVVGDLATLLNFTKGLGIASISSTMMTSPPFWFCLDVSMLLGPNSKSLSCERVCSHFRNPMVIFASREAMRGLAHRPYETVCSEPDPSKSGITQLSLHTAEFFSYVQ